MRKAMLQNEPYVLHYFKPLAMVVNGWWRGKKKNWWRLRSQNVKNNNNKL